MKRKIVQHEVAMARVRRAIKARVDSGRSLAAQALEKKLVPAKTTLYVVSGSVLPGRTKAKVKSLMQRSKDTGQFEQAKPTGKPHLLKRLKLTG